MSDESKTIFTLRAPEGIFTLRAPEGIRGKAPSYDGRRGFFSHFEDSTRGLMVFFWEEHSVEGNLHVIENGKWVRHEIGNMCKHPPRAKLQDDAWMWFSGCFMQTTKLRQRAKDEEFARDHDVSLSESIRLRGGDPPPRIVIVLETSP